MMTAKPLYRYTRDDGGITVSPEKPNTDYTEKIRLIADKGKVLTKNGTDFYSVIDVNSASGWREVDAPAEYLHFGNLEQENNFKN